MLIAFVVAWETRAFAEDIDISGFTAAEVRIFTGTPMFESQESEPQVSYILSPEFRFKTDDQYHQFTLNPFVRIDSMDDERTHFDLREAYWRFTYENWQLLVGVNKVFWGVAESQHLVDIINQNDAVEDIDAEDKLGQPMVLLGTQLDWGEVQLFLMPYFRERTFPGKDGRLRSGIPVDQGGVSYESSAEEYHLDLAARYSHYFGDWDVGTYYFYGTSREPMLRLNGSSNRLLPFYELIHQFGADVQYTKEAWLWKFEGILREGQGDFFGAAVGGFEYTLYQVFKSSADLGLLLEYHIDDRNEGETPVTIFDNDVFLGSRVAFNDPQDTSALLGSVLDTDTATTFVFFEAARRIGDTWKIEVEARIFANIDSADPSFSIQSDDFVNISIQRHF